MKPERQRRLVGHESAAGSCRLTLILAPPSDDISAPLYSRVWLTMVSRRRTLYDELGVWVFAAPFLSLPCGPVEHPALAYRDRATLS